MLGDFILYTGPGEHDVVVGFGFSGYIFGILINYRIFYGETSNFDSSNVFLIASMALIIFVRKWSESIKKTSSC